MALDLLLLYDQSSGWEVPEHRALSTRLGLPKDVRLHRDVPGEPSLAMALLSAAARARGFSVEVVDNFRHFPASYAKLRRLLREKAPLAVGLCTTLLADRGTIRDIVRHVRRECPAAKVLLGGAALWEEPGLAEIADAAVLAEGERALPDILDRLKAGEPLAGIPGVVCPASGVRPPLPAAEPQDMDATPFPDWSFRPGEKSIYPLETQRGCALSCEFCTHPVYAGSVLRQKSLQRLLGELRANYERYGITLYRIIDPTFTLPPERCKALCEAIARLGLPLRWTCYALAQHMRDLAGVMAEAGCRGVFMGIESGDDDILRRMSKRCTRDQILEGVRACKDAGIASYGSFFIGFPGETERTVRNTVSCVLDSGLEFFRIGILRVDPTSPLYARREDYGLSGTGVEWRHATADSHKALEWAFQAELEILRAQGPFLGMDFDLSAYVRAGLGFEDAMAFQRSKGYLTAHETLRRWRPGALETRGFTPEGRRRQLELARAFGEKAELGAASYRKAYGLMRRSPLIPACDAFRTPGLAGLVDRLRDRLSAAVRRAR